MVMLLQIAMWEEYAGKLEEQLRALVQDNQLLQGALQAVRTSLASGQPASPASTGETNLQSHCSPSVPFATTCHTPVAGLLSIGMSFKILNHSLVQYHVRRAPCNRPRGAHDGWQSRMAGSCLGCQKGHRRRAQVTRQRDMSG